MKCVMCKTGDLQEGTTTVTLEHDEEGGIYPNGTAKRI